MMELARASSGPGDPNTGYVTRLDRGASPSPDRRFTVSKSGRGLLRRNDGTPQWHLSRAAMGTNVPLDQFLRRRGGVVVLGR